MLHKFKKKERKKKLRKSYQEKKWGENQRQFPRPKTERKKERKLRIKWGKWTDLQGAQSYLFVWVGVGKKGKLGQVGASNGQVGASRV